LLYTDDARSFVQKCSGILAKWQILLSNGDATIGGGAMFRASLFFLKNLCSDGEQRLCRILQF